MRIAIVGAATIYASGSGAEALWDTAVQGRRWFRDIPATRLPLAEYPNDPSDPESITVNSAALIDGWEFDRHKFKIPQDQFLATDTTHWLALDVCSQLLEGMGELNWLDHDRVGVVLGNSLTGEVSRAHSLRLRWPYVRQSLLAAAQASGCDLPAGFLQAAESAFKEPFAVPGTDTLAGGLSNTIAGRLTNYFDFHGLGYTIDGACASSLLSVTQVKALLESRTIDLGIAGGVDMSIDPFELIGFSRLGAMASGDMRIYDTEPTGFLPGEGCGMVALMREGDAIRQGLPVLASIIGAGMSSDGSGGLTRPAESGHILAIQRAYQDAGVSPDRVGLFEGHGTGTAVGDPAEINVLSSVRAPDAGRAALGSVKANIGHTKAAAGIAGLIKSVWAAKEGVLPPSTGVVSPHPGLRAAENLEVIFEPRPWNEDRRTVGVSALGFGGINSHVVLESSSERAVDPFGPTIHGASNGLLIVTGDDTAGVAATLEGIAKRALTLSDAECIALASETTRAVRLPARVRVAFGLSGRRTLLASAAFAKERLDALGANGSSYYETSPSLSIGIGRPGRAGVMFPGQGAPIIREPLGLRPALGDGPWAMAVDRGSATLAQMPGNATDVAQVAILTAELAGVGFLEALGVEAGLGFGHSLGELAALAWAGMAEPTEVIDLARIRGQLMNLHGRSGTGMTAIEATADDIAVMIDDAEVYGCELAAVNGRRQIVVGGPMPELDQLTELARRRGIRSQSLPVSHAFHTAAMADAVPSFKVATEKIAWRTPGSGRAMISTVSGDQVTATTDIAKLLTSQLTEPVTFGPVASAAVADLDLLVEVGPGRTLASLVADLGTPTVSMDIGGRPSALIETLASLVALGQVSDLAAWEAIAAKRLDVPQRALGLRNPAASASSAAVPLSAPNTSQPTQKPTADPLPDRGPIPPRPSHTPSEVTRDGILTIFKGAIERMTGLQVDLDQNDLRLSTDLHLNSLQVNHLLGEVAEEAGLSIPADPLAMSEATVGEAIDLLSSLPDRGAEPTLPLSWPWICDFIDEWTEVGQCDTVDYADVPTVTIGSELPDLPDSLTTLRLVLPEHPGDKDLLELRDLVRDRDWETVLIQHCGEGVAAARALFYDRTSRDQSWVLLDHSCVGPDILPELPRSQQFHDLRVDHDGTLQQRVCRRAARESRPFSFSASHPVLLVTGGVHGITAICAMELASSTGAELIFVGRTARNDRAINQALARMAAAGYTADYISVDLTDPDAVRAALCPFAPAITGILHGAAINEPQVPEAVDGEALRRARAVKATGLDAMLDALDRDHLELIVTFGSIIERAGMSGQLAYAAANERLRLRTELLDLELDNALVLHLRWSIWSELGMGEGLGVLDSLRRAGVVPISPEAGRAQFAHQLSTRGPVTRLVMGRFPQSETLRFQPAARSGTWRFIEEIASEVPGTELVAHAELSVPTDRALREHRISKIPVMPAVLALEAAAQAASALHPGQRWNTLTDFSIQRAVSIPEQDDRARLTVASAGSADGSGDVFVRITHAQADVASVRVRAMAELPAESSSTHQVNGFAGVDSPFYDSLLFHEGAFRRLAELHSTSASRVSATLASAPAKWFSAFLPQRLVLGDPGLLDASLHALQVCYPQLQLLPMGADSVVVANPWPATECSLEARELDQSGEVLRFDVDVNDQAGDPVLRWRGLSLQPSHPLDAELADSRLVAPLIAREARQLGWRNVDAVVTPNTRPATEALSLLGAEGTVHPSGGLHAVASGHASSSSSAGLRLVAFGPDPIGVDWEIGAVPAPALPAPFEGVGRGLGDLPADRSALMVWTALEACKKTGFGFDGLTLSSYKAMPAMCRATFKAGPTRAVVVTTTVAGEPVCVALARSTPSERI